LFCFRFTTASRSRANPEGDFLPNTKGPQQVVRVDLGHVRATGAAGGLPKRLSALKLSGRAFPARMFVNRLQLSFEQSRTS
jgi:hypothetical protein